MSIKDLSQKAYLVGADVVPIYDSESGRTRAVTAQSISKFVDINYVGKHVVSGALTDGTLTLKFTDESTIDIDGFVYDTTSLPDMPQVLESGKILKVNPTGDGYILVSEASIGVEIEVYNNNILVDTVGGINVPGALFGAPSGGTTTLSVVGIPENIGQTNEIYTYDQATNRLVATGIYAMDGTLMISPDSLLFGSHKMSSSPENIIFKNVVTGKNYSPPSQEVGANKGTAYVRVYGPQTTVVRVPDSANDVINPVNIISVNDDELGIGGKFILSQPATNVRLKLEDNGIVRWESKYASLSAGEHIVTFDIPIDLRAGYTYTISLTSDDGDITAKGNPGTGEFSWTVYVALWEEKALARAEDTPENFTDLGDTPASLNQPGYILAVNQNGDAIVLSQPTLESGLLSDINVTTPAAGDTLIYTGTEWQNEKPIPQMQISSNLDSGSVGVLEDFASNYVYVKRTTNVESDMPEVNDVNWLWVANDSVANSVTYNALPGTTIAGSSSIVIDPKTQVALSFNGISNWAIVYTAPYDTTPEFSLGDLTDVELNSPEEDEVLAFKLGQWVNFKPPHDINGEFIAAGGQAGGSIDKASNLVVIKNDMPYDYNMVEAEDGNILMIRNMNEGAGESVELIPFGADTIESLNSVEIEPQTEAIYVYDEEDVNWVLAYKRPLIPEDGLGRVGVGTLESSPPIVTTNYLTFPFGTVSPGAVNPEAAEIHIPMRTKLDSLRSIVNLIEFSSKFSLTEFVDAQDGDSVLVDMDTSELYEKPVNSMSQLTSPTLIPPTTGTYYVLALETGLLSDSRVVVNPTTKTWTLPHVATAGTTNYEVKLRLKSDSTIVNPVDGSRDDFTLFLGQSGNNQSTIVDFNGDGVEYQFSVYKDQEFGVREVTAELHISADFEFYPMLYASNGDSIVLLTDEDTRLSVTQINDPENAVTLTEIYEDILSREIITRDSFVLGGDFISQPFDIGAEVTPKTLNEGDIVDVANHWKLVALEGQWYYSRDNDHGLYVTANNGDPAPWKTAYAYYVVPADTTQSIRRTDEESVTITAKFRGSGDEIAYILGWEGQPDEVPNIIATSTSGPNNSILDFITDMKTLDRTEMQNNSFPKADTASATIHNIPDSVNNLVFVFTCNPGPAKPEFWLQNFKAELGKSFTGFELSDGQDNIAFDAVISSATGDDTQFAQAQSTAENILLESISFVEPSHEFYLEVFPATGEVLFNHGGTYLMDYLAAVERAPQGGMSGAAQIYIWLEKSDDGGVSWDVIEGTSSSTPTNGNTEGLLVYPAALCSVKMKKGDRLRARMYCEGTDWNYLGIRAYGVPGSTNPPPTSGFAIRLHKY